ncbi:FAD-dependent oxidoreductase [Gordonia shandongensis]|uniref:FAD-dependent oxidoreductase n=1 Tax=Gordonia shandongensis TaxID=376351 RepID=UPI0004225B6E|nr:FAD-dependent oxidoreductase [Gordonia shandongensis]
MAIGNSHDGEISRRAFIVGAGATAASVAALGLAAPSVSAAPRARRRVAVFGGGPGGLTAAQELTERGFSVSVFERHAVLGGKCRSQPVPGTASGGRQGLPIEPGLHVLYGGYPHMNPMFERIPLSRRGSVQDNILKVQADDMGFVVQFVTSLLKAVTPRKGFDIREAAMVKALSSFAAELPQVNPADVALIVSKMMAIITSGKRRRSQVLENVSVPQFTGAEKLDPFTSFVWDEAWGQFGNALDTVSAKAMANGLLRISGWFGTEGLYDQRLMGIFSAPTNDALVRPWREYLEKRGVRFHTGQRLVRLACSAKTIDRAFVRDSAGRISAVDADWYVLAMPPDKCATVMNPQILSADPRLSGLAKYGKEPFAAVHLFYYKRPDLVAPMLHSRWFWAAFEYSDLWPFTFSDYYGDGKVRDYLTVDVGQVQRKGLLGKRIPQMSSKMEYLDEMKAQYGRFDIDIARGLARFELGPQYQFGRDGRIVNDEPCFTHPVSGYKYFPNNDARKIGNLFFGSSCAMTSTEADCVDSAVEGGRRAANAILDAAGSSASPAWVRALEEPSPLFRPFWDEDDRRYAAGRPNLFDVVSPYRA